MELLSSQLSTLRTVDPGTLDQEYSVVRSQTSSLKRKPGLTSEVGALKENVKKNRYKDILPYDQSRVVLSLLTSESDSDYINASFIKGAAGEHKYIGAQAPLASTLTDFWRMIWQHDIKVIVMACREIEMGKKKCECYWAPLHQSAAFGPFIVYNQGETQPNEDLMVRTLTVTYQKDSRSLVQYQFLSWPDHDVPYEAAGVLNLLERARNTQGTHTSPLLIHCSAGCGRTGVICALDYIHDLLVTKQITSDFSIMKIVLELRRQRPSAVQTKDQYQFIFTVVTSMFEKMLQQSSPLYSNLSKPQRPEKKSRARAAASPTSRQSIQADMNDTYAVVNKPKHPQPSAPVPTYSAVATPRSNNASSLRSPPTSHHYDNDAMSGPVYSAVRPRARHVATPIYDIAAPANHMLGEGPQSPSTSADYQLLPAERLPSAEDEYEDFSSSSSFVTDTTNLCSPGGIGFNCRIQKPRGPRDPPVEWSRIER